MSIELHPEKGVNPRVTRCRQCGKDVGVALLGRQNHKYTCPKCGQVHIGLPDRGPKKPFMPNRRACQKCDEDYGSHWKKEEIPDHESLVVDLCTDCEKLNAAARKIVEEGGIYWTCKDCGAGGAIKAESELAKEVREVSDVKAPDPVGYEFDKTHCPACGPNAVVGKEADDAEVPGP